MGRDEAQPMLCLLFFQMCDSFKTSNKENNEAILQQYIFSHVLK